MYNFGFILCTTLDLFYVQLWIYSMYNFGSHTMLFPFVQGLLILIAPFGIFKLFLMCVS